MRSIHYGAHLFLNEMIVIQKEKDGSLDDPSLIIFCC